MLRTVFVRALQTITVRNIKMLTKAGYEGHARCMAHSLATASVAIAIVVIDLAMQVPRQ